MLVRDCPLFVLLAPPISSCASRLEYRKRHEREQYKQPAGGVGPE